MVDDIEIMNAVVKSVSLSTADHGCLSACLHLSYGDGCEQGFGAYALYVPNSPELAINNVNYAGHFIWRCAEVAGVSDWKDIPGKPIRVRSNGHGIEAIGHFIKNIWFYPRQELTAIENRGKENADENAAKQ